MKKIALIVLAVVVVLFLWFSLYTIDETEQAIILEFGKPMGETISSPGLHFKLPWRSVIKFENRILEYDVEPQAIITKDKKKLEVDNYARWRIADPLLFYRSVRTLNGALSRIDPIVYSELRVELGKHVLSDIVDSNRVKIMETVSNETQIKLADYGIDIIDVRIKRADLSKENERAVFDRMRAERQRKAKQYRSEGEEEALMIRAETDKKKTIILANAYKESQILKGEGDAKAVEIYADAFKSDPKFYEFIRTLEAYEKVVDKKSTLILSTDSDLFDMLKGTGR
ncbi:MAG: protease modulator HflC [Candidatus Marinimicrobia bacterium]|jgi:membrane protease subunit HflC|nr:protease modulator HflC [Candidatus Neomarinimicrobiota bacterium]MDP7025649.1 protease modulator HflC [Candidatus Neomarinimicrobiota bacterium]|tara:strand:- start:17065 stop:17919 length:855 start_codon:yes stop_codon:yes gene_type:complete